VYPGDIGATYDLPRICWLVEKIQLALNFLPLSFPETNEYQWENPHWDERHPQEKHPGKEKEIGKD
jgi:hypothetical protein